jgi:hypothetical protein
MNKKHIILYSLLLCSWWSLQALADWQAAGPSGTNITFDAVTNGSKQIQKHVNVDASGIQVGTASSPIFTTINGSGNTAVVSPAGGLSVNFSQVNGATPSAANPVPVAQSVGGSLVSAANPLSIQLSQGAAAVGASNPIPSQLVVSGAAVSSGNPLPVTNILAEPATYSWGATFTLAANATDIVVIQGSATKTIKIKRIGFNTNGTIFVGLYRRTSAQSGGTCASQSSAFVKHDTTDASATAALVLCTVNPTPGTSAGRLRSSYLVAGTFIDWTFSGVNDKPIYLRGTSDYVALNGEASNASQTGFIWIEWTEE